MDVLRGKFHAVLNDPSITWRREDGKYENQQVELAWHCVNSLGAAIDDSVLVDRMVALGPQELRRRFRDIIVAKFDGLGWSQAKFAAALGIHQSEVSWIIHNKENTGLEKLMEIAKRANQLKECGYPIK